MIHTPKRDNEHPRSFHWYGSSPPPHPETGSIQACRSQGFLFVYLFDFYFGKPPQHQYQTSFDRSATHEYNLSKNSRFQCTARCRSTWLHCSFLPASYCISTELSKHPDTQVVYRQRGHLLDPNETSQRRPRSLRTSLPHNQHKGLVHKIGERPKDNLRKETMKSIRKIDLKLTFVSKICHFSWSHLCLY